MRQATTTISINIYSGGGVDVGITYHQDAEGAKRTAEEVRERGARTAVRHLDLTDLPTSTAAIDELAEHGITVNSVAPGEISTPMSGQEDVDPRQQRRPGVPLGRTGHAREVAAVVASWPLRLPGT